MSTLYFFVHYILCSGLDKKRYVLYVSCIPSGYILWAGLVVSVIEDVLFYLRFFLQFLQRETNLVTSSLLSSTMQTFQK